MALHSSRPKSGWTKGAWGGVLASACGLAAVFAIAIVNRGEFSGSGTHKLAAQSNAGEAGAPTGLPQTSLPLTSVQSFAYAGGAKVVSPVDVQTFRVGLPAAAASGLSKMVLRIGISAFEPSLQGTTSFIVAVARPGSAQSARAGYISVFPAKAFSGSSPRQYYSFDLTRPLAEIGATDGPLDVTVRASVQNGSATAGASAGDVMTVSTVEIEPTKPAR